MDGHTHTHMYIHTTYTQHTHTHTHSSLVYSDIIHMAHARTRLLTGKFIIQ